MKLNALKPALKPALGLLSLAALFSLAPGAHAQQFASSVAAYSNLNTSGLFSNPNAALGQPSTLTDDTFKDLYHASAANPTYGVDPNGKNLLVSFGSTGQGSLTVKFDNAPIVHSDAHWFGQDFIVYGNSFFQGHNNATGDDFVHADTDLTQTDMTQYHVTNGAAYANGIPTVSVSANGADFVTLTSADTMLFPENPYKWVGISAQNPSGWEDTPGNLQDFSKPVDPSLTAAEFDGKSIADVANTLYGGSAGGFSFSLAGTQFATTGISYVRFTGLGNIDGVSRVSDAPQSAPVPEASTALSLAVGLLVIGGVCLRRKARVTG